MDSGFDPVARPLDEVLAECEAAKTPVRTEMAAPPRPRDDLDPARLYVIAWRHAPEGGLVLTAAAKMIRPDADESPS